jgi:uncharacterized membrane protein
MSQYSFVTTWKFNAPIENVWAIIRDMDSWPEWWKYVQSVKLISAGDADDIGSIRRIVWTTALPYELKFDSELISVEHLKSIKGKAYGDLTGVGIWTFSHDKGVTSVRYDWTVSTTKIWMNLFAPIAKPLFKWNHDKVMNAGYKGLQEKLTTHKATSFA